MAGIFEFHFFSRNVDDIELLPGGITETRLPNSLFGPVFKCIIERQFQLLRDGDRFWYQTSDPVTGFSRGKLIDNKDNLYRGSCKSAHKYLTLFVLIDSSFW